MLKWIASVVAVGALFVGCSSGGLSQAAQEALGLQNAPKWVRTLGEGPYSAVGSAVVVNRNVGFAKNEALMKARAELVRELGVKIKTTSSVDASRKDGELTEEVKESILGLAQLDLKDTQVADFWASDDGKEVWVLVKLSSETVDKMKKAVENGGGDFSAFEKMIETPSSSTTQQ